MFGAFPKIFALGTDYVRDIFKGPVEITEKLDGSQFAFGWDGDRLRFRSKGKEQLVEAPDKMFAPAISYIESVADCVLPGYVYYAEWFAKPKHNALAYERTPKNGLALFGVADSTRTRFVSEHAELEKAADSLGVDAAPLVFRGEISSLEEVLAFLGRESYLGGAKIEGVVVKNYAQAFLLGGQPIPLMAAKLVSEEFKEVHKAEWGGQTGPGKFEILVESYRTEARWQKAMQHLRDDGKLTNEPRDIGALVKEVQRDICEEETEAIKAALFDIFGGQILRRSTAGLPEWYKEQLAQRSFE